MTREKAIEVFTELNYAYKADEYGDYFYDHGDMVCEAANVAIAALREQGGSFQNGNDHNTVKDWPPYMDLPREQDVTDINVGNKWISVEERLPEDDVEVLTRRATGMNVEAHCGFGWDYDEYNGKWRVTHWMPLPEPPEVEV